MILVYGQSNAPLTPLYESFLVPDIIFTLKMMPYKCCAKKILNIKIVLISIRKNDFELCKKTSQIMLECLFV